MYSSEKKIYKYPCEECGKIIISETTKKRFCKQCIKARKTQKVKDWYKKQKTIFIKSNLRG